MIEILLFMAPAICMCIILAGICGYVGVHVIMREVIFIDIALAQIAALGASLGLFLGIDLANPLIYVISMSVTLIAALILSEARRLSSYVPQEAFIGILYATGAAAVMLAGDRLPHGNEHVHDLMVGHLLWVSWKEVGFYFLIYAALGAIYALCHKRLYQVSQDSKGAKSEGVSLVLWDFIFYALMGILVTFAVRVAGVLLVFGFLIVPAVLGSLLAQTFRTRLIVGWVAGAIVSFIGSYLSYSLDYPTGATVVVTLGLSLFLVAAVKILFLKKQGEQVSSSMS